MIISSNKMTQVVDKHKLPLSWPCLPLPIPSPYIIINHWTELLVLYNNFPLASYFIHGSVYMPMLLSQFITSSPSPTVSTNLFSASASLFLPHRETHQYHFSRFHIDVLIHSICFSLSEKLTSLSTTGSNFIHLSSTDSKSVHSFLWLSNTPLYIWATASLTIHLSIDV